MSRDAKYAHHSLNVFLTEKAIADEVAAEAGIDIEYQKPVWFGPAAAVEDMAGVFCETEEEGARFRRAFNWRRWGDGQKPQGK